MNLKDKVTQELESVRSEMDELDEYEALTLEGWQNALLWVLKQIEEGESK